MRKLCTVLQHVKKDDLGILEEVFTERDFLVDRLYAGEGVGAQALEASLLFVLGGPMGVEQELLYPFLTQEVSLLKERVAQQMPTLGICLGAQLMAKAAGASIYPQGYDECGWNPLELTEAGTSSCLKLLQDTPVFHWHSETFDLPKGGELLASTSLCQNQAFSIGKNILGLQFHIEATLQKISLFAPSFTMISGAQERAKQALHVWLDSIDSR
jgi:GMP synthase (glutamine-hydrolysing)